MPESLVPDPISLSLHASQVSKQVVAYSSSLSCSMRHLIDNSGLGTIVTGHQFQRICQLAVPPNLVEKPANAVSKPASFWPTVRAQSMPSSFGRWWFEAEGCLAACCVNTHAEHFQCSKAGSRRRLT